MVESDELYGEVETQFLLFGLLLHTQPLNSSEQHTKADLEFSSDFGFYFLLVATMNFWFVKSLKGWNKQLQIICMLIDGS